MGNRFALVRNKTSSMALSELLHTSHDMIVASIGYYTYGTGLET